ncbi:MAG: MATE family efflux transporter [Anaerolineae bacterium]
MAVSNRSVTTAPTLVLTRENIPRNIVKLALPAVTENLLVTMVYLADTLLIGRLKDPAALAAVSLGGLFLNIATQLFSAISVAATTLVAHAWGGALYEQARHVAAQAILFAIIFAAGAIALMWPSASALLALMGASTHAIAMGSTYMRIVLVALLLGFPMIVLNGIMRGSGDTRTPMTITLVMNVWHVLVATLLIFGPGPLPALGLSGAAWATASAQMLGGCLALFLVMSGKKFLKLHWRDILRWDGQLIRQILHLSLPAAGESLVMRLGFTLFMRIVSALGEIPLAAHQIAVNVESLSFMPGFGLGVASTTLVGQSLGARKPELAEESIRSTMRISVVLMGAVGVIFALFGPALASIFGSTPEVLALAGSAVRIGALEQLPIAVLMVIAGSLRGAGDTRTPMLATLLGTLFFRVPLVYLFAIVFRWGLNGVWLGTAVDWTARATLIYLLFRRGTWKRLRL